MSDNLPAPALLLLDKVQRRVTNAGPTQAYGRRDRSASYDHAYRVAGEIYGEYMEGSPNLSWVNELMDGEDPEEHYGPNNSEQECWELALKDRLVQAAMDAIKHPYPHETYEIVVDIEGDEATLSTYLILP